MPTQRRRSTVTPEAMLMCQTIGHSWFPYDAERRPRFGVLWQLRCDRCTAMRDDLVDRHGNLLSRAYQYPDGYRDAHLDLDSRADRRAHLLTVSGALEDLRVVKREAG